MDRPISKTIGGDNEDGDHVVDRIMKCHMESWISENLDEEVDKKLKYLTLSVCIREEDDYPHPRHLCFKYPFGNNSSLKRHCKKCYCYICEEVAPCKKWNKPKMGHCRANADDQIWKSAKEARKKVPGFNTTRSHHNVTVSFMHYPPDQTVLIEGSAGGMICDTSTGKWVAGFSEHIRNDLGRRDSSVPPYIALIEALKLAWSRGLRFLDVELGYLYHDGFWEDFYNDLGSSNFRLCKDEACTNTGPRVWSILREVEMWLNKDWFIKVKNSPTIKEESGALALAMMACWQPRKAVYDFPSHPLTPRIEFIAHQCKTVTGPLCEALGVFRVFKDLKTYSTVTCD